MNLQERLELDGYNPICDDPIFFYGKRNDYGEFSNFSPHEIQLLHPFTGLVQRYSTAEHRYQACKATNKTDHDIIRAQARPSDTKKLGRQIQLRESWGNDYGDLCWYVMFELVLAKFSQHDHLQKLLLSTDDRLIYEDSPTDDIWGIRYAQDYRGKNLLGRVLMEVREILS